MVSGFSAVLIDKLPFHCGEVTSDRSFSISFALRVHFW
jgi:hypothetical protein